MRKALNKILYEDQSQFLKSIKSNQTSMKRIYVQLVFICFLLIPISIFAHRPDRSLIYLRVYETAGIEGRFEMNAVDINKYLGLDLKKHPTVEEVRVYEEQIKAYILKHSAFSSVNGKHKNNLYW